MTALPIERADLGAVTIEALDFDPPCAGADCPHPAFALVAGWCNECGTAEEDFICTPHWTLFGKGNVLCTKCGDSRPRDECMRIIARVRP